MGLVKIANADSSDHPTKSSPIENLKRSGGTKHRSDTNISLVDIFGLGQRKNTNNTTQDIASRSSSSSSHPVHRSMADSAPRVPCIRTLRSGANSEQLVDGQTASKIPLPGLFADLLLPPPSESWEESDSGPSKHVPVRVGYRTPRHRAPAQHFGTNSNSHVIQESSSEFHRTGACVHPEPTAWFPSQNANISQIYYNAKQHPNTDTRTTGTMPISFPQGFQQGQLQSPSSQQQMVVSRPRSRAIAIKRPSNHRYSEHNSACSEENNERMYDWATWRMYNRIVDHRRNQQLARASTMTPSVDMHLATQASYMDRLRSSQATMQTTATEDLTSDYILDGEVFELDI